MAGGVLLGIKGPYLLFDSGVLNARRLGSYHVEVAYGATPDAEYVAAPSVRELARRLPANQNTVLKAYDLLANEGLLSRRQGDGTFVTDAPATIKKSEHS